MLINGYGMVELGGLAMMGVELSFLPGSGDLCFPVPPFRIRVADENGRPAGAGVIGECQIRRRGLSPHYWKDKVKDEELLTDDGWLRTGDLATRNRLGMVRLVGRMKDVIKSNLAVTQSMSASLKKQWWHIQQWPAPLLSVCLTKRKVKFRPEQSNCSQDLQPAKPICLTGAERISPPTRHRAAFGFLKLALCHKITPARFSAAPSKNVLLQR